MLYWNHNFSREEGFHDQNQMRIELKKNVVRKQQKELYNQELYTYMHDIFGPDVMELFDLKYQPKLKAAEKEENSGGEKK